VNNVELMLLIIRSLANHSEPLTLAQWNGRPITPPSLLYNARLVTIQQNMGPRQIGQINRQMSA
jgi:hypothetical protein